MTTLTAHKRTARYENGFVFVDIDGVVEIKFGIAANHRLSKGNESQLRNIEVSPFGLHWPTWTRIYRLRGWWMEIADAVSSFKLNNGPTGWELALKPVNCLLFAGKSAASRNIATATTVWT
jgi:hypothetical protein